MDLKKLLLYILKSILKLYNYEIIQSHNLYDWQKTPEALAGYNPTILTNEAKEFLHLNNPRIKELKLRYTKLDKDVTSHLLWKDTHLGPDDIQYFRGDNPYVWQFRGPNMNILGYTLTTFYVKSIDNLDLLKLLEEDECFGNFTFSIDNKIISRDLLDSIIEIYFLEKYLNLSLLTDITILDIGAGYGRLAHRMVNALPNIKEYLCTDAIAISTFISEFYLKFRGIDNRAKVVPLDKIEVILNKKSVSIAINIHSFSECGLSAIDWWMSLLKKNTVKYLMIVPNSDNHGGELLLTVDGKDFSEVIEKYGYKLIAKEPKYRDEIVQKYAINPTYFHLFELQ